MIQPIYRELIIANNDRIFYSINFIKYNILSDFRCFEVSMYHFDFIAVKKCKTLSSIKRYLHSDFPSEWLAKDFNRDLVLPKEKEKFREMFEAFDREFVDANADSYADELEFGSCNPIHLSFILSVIMLWQAAPVFIC